MVDGVDISLLSTHSGKVVNNMSQYLHDMFTTAATLQDIGNDSSGPVSQLTNMSSPASIEVRVLLSMLFFVIGAFGIVGNSLVIIVILMDRKMRQSVTNLFIMNLAIADLLIMLFGIPDIVQFILNKGWLLGQALCKTDRFILVVSLYVSVLSLVSVCIERFVAIVYPIKAHILCGKTKIVIAIACVWPTAIACGLPTILFVQVDTNPIMGTKFCFMNMPDPERNFPLYGFMEFAIFYFVPSCIQACLYAVIGVRLYASTEELNTRFQMRSDSNARTDRSAETIRARKGVVKMLAASVIVYVVCYAPPQVLLFYNTFSNRRFAEKWSFLAFVMIIAQVNSAANPVLYSIFSQNFRRNFKKCLCCICQRIRKKEYQRARCDSFDSRGVSRRTSTSRTTVSRV